MTHHPIWNFDPSALNLLDVTINGKPTPIALVASKNGMLYTFNRETGVPVWPIVERPVPASTVPGEKLARTQPFPTKPVPFEPQGLTMANLIGYTPELRQEAIEILTHYQWGPQYNPPIQVGHPSGLRSFVSCPSGAANIQQPPSADPETGIYYQGSQMGCRAENIVPGAEMDDAESPMTTGNTLSQYVVANRGDFRGPQGLPIYKPPYSKVSAIDMNTGEYLWSIPNGVTPDRIKNHPALKGVNLPNTGVTSAPITLVTKTLLITSEGLRGEPVLHAHDKKTGKVLGTVNLPAQGQYGMMTYMHGGQQYIVVQVMSATHPGALAALRLPTQGARDDHKP
jgi:quinoprotein glucose dehydrogenase